MQRVLSVLICVAVASLVGCAHKQAGPIVQSNFKEQSVTYLVKGVPDILKSQDKSTGKFGEGIWLVIDQNVMWPLAVAWSLDRPDNPYYHNADVLQAIIAGGDALIADQDKKGMWEFRKKDGSTWGPIFMPWTYSRWIRSYGIIKDAMSPEKRAKWEKAITLGVEGIIKEELTKPMANIPAHHAMAVFHAGQVFDRKDWRKAGKAYIDKVVKAQDVDGFWTEHLGPVVAYNFVYVDLLGCYYGMSHDKSVLPALRKASMYHANFTYPDGTAVETVDERNPYHNAASMGGVGFTFSPEGRGYMQQQWSRRKTALSPDLAASIIAYGEDGPIATPGGAGSANQYVMGKNDAMTARNGPWFACIAAYRAEISDKRWIQDRQNFVSLFHQKTGLVLGGGNTKLQPLWSTFTVGDTKLLNHKPGTTSPVFLPPPGIRHTPTARSLDPKGMTLGLTYDKTQCSVHVDISDANTARLTYALVSKSDLPVEAHVTLMPAMKTAWKTASGLSGTLSEEPINLTADQAGAWFEHHGCRVSIPTGSSITWPVLPHNPYTKDGHAEAGEGRIVISMPMGKEPTEREIEVNVP